SQNAQSDESGFSQILATDEEPTEDSAKTQTSQPNTKWDVFVLDTSSLYAEKPLPPLLEKDL
ncbi:hypothetical protein C1646_778070, partial [Rhizophagus diaphanus]